MSIFMPDIQLCFASLRMTDTPSLLRAENRSAALFSPGRRHEFATGRNCARLAMRAFGIEPVEVPQAPDRSPVWPTGIVGSISHSDSWCVAAVSLRASGYLSIGIDIEPLEPLPEDTRETILSVGEQNWISTQPSPYRALLGRLFFSAKECAYKCQYPLSRKLLDFHAMQVRIDWREQTFVAQFTEDAHPFLRLDVIHGRFTLENDHFVCGAALRSVRRLTESRRADGSPTGS